MCPPVCQSHTVVPATYLREGDSIDSHSNTGSSKPYFVNTGSVFCCTPVTRGQSDAHHTTFLMQAGAAQQQASGRVQPYGVDNESVLKPYEIELQKRDRQIHNLEIKLKEKDRRISNLKIQLVEQRAQLIEVMGQSSEKNRLMGKMSGHITQQFAKKTAPGSSSIGGLPSTPPIFPIMPSPPAPGSSSIGGLPSTLPIFPIMPSPPAPGSSSIGGLPSTLPIFPIMPSPPAPGASSIGGLPSTLPFFPIMSSTPAPFLLMPAPSVFPGEPAPSVSPVRSSPSVSPGEPAPSVSPVRSSSPVSPGEPTPPVSPVRSTPLASPVRPAPSASLETPTLLLPSVTYRFKKSFKATFSEPPNEKLMQVPSRAEIFGYTLVKDDGSTDVININQVLSSKWRELAEVFNIPEKLKEKIENIVELSDRVVYVFDIIRRRGVSDDCGSGETVKFSWKLLYERIAGIDEIREHKQIKAIAKFMGVKFVPM